MSIAELREMKETCGIEENLWDQVLSHFQAMDLEEQEMALMVLEQKLRAQLGKG